MKPASPKIRIDVPPPRTWDGRLARRLVVPLVGTAVTPNHLTTLRLAIGIAGAVALARPEYAWANVGAFLIVLSNFVDHTDGELARIGGLTSRFGHLYDLACDAIVTVALFAAMGVGVYRRDPSTVAPIAAGVVAGVAVAAIFFARMRIEEMAGKAGTRQSFAAGFETEDVLYLLPLVTAFDVAAPFVTIAAIGASLFAAWVLVDWARVARRTRTSAWSTR